MLGRTGASEKGVHQQQSAAATTHLGDPDMRYVHEPHGAQLVAALAGGLLGGL